MKTTTFLSVLFAIFLSSCTTVYYTQSYEDANYLTQDEFSHFEDYTAEDLENERNTIVSDTAEDGTVINNYYGDYYEADDYYDFSYSARIRRFHRPVWSMGYYGGLYTDYYWYSYNPYHCGLSIYYGYNYNPYYSPYYSWGYSGYYSPYYSYYNHHHYGHHHHHGHHYHNNDTYSYHNSYDNNSVYYGPRGSVSSRSNSNRSVKTVVSSSPNNKNTSYDKFNMAVDKKITQRQIKNSSNKGVKTNVNRTTTKSNITKSTINRGVKTNTYKGNRSHTTKSNTYKGNSNSNRTYTNPKSNSNRSYNNSRGSTTKSSGSSNRSSGTSRSGNRSVKPRK